MDPHHAQQDSSTHLHRVADCVPSMLAYWDRGLRCRFANRAYLTWFGVQGDQLLGTSIRDLLGSALFALNEPYILGALRGESQTFERAIPGPDGLTRHSLAHYHPDWQDGQVVGFIVTVTEVTALKRTEQQLQATITQLQAEAEQRRQAEAAALERQQGLSVTLASIDAGFITTDAQGRVTQLNAVAERLTGWSQAHALGRSLWQVFERENRPPEMCLRNPVDEMLDRAVRIDQVHEVVMLARDGRRTPVALQAALTHGPDGTVLGLAIVMRDRSRALRAEIDASELAAIVESSSDAIIGRTLPGIITSWNRGAQALFGYSPDEVIGQPVTLLLPPGRQDEERAVLAALGRGERVPPWDTVRQCRDSSLVDVSITISPVHDAQGRIVGASKIARDITPRKRAEAAQQRVEALAAENRQIQEANRLKSLFLANMSHELRTPLNAVIGFAELLRSGRIPPDSERHATYLEHIASSGRHLLQLINDVLDLSKVEAGKFSFHPEPLQLRPLVQEVVEGLQPQAERKAIAVLVEVAPGLPTLQLDPARLRQVLYNFLSNAIKFTGQGGHVAVRAWPDVPGCWRLEVADDGIGIAAEQLPRLFVEFQQLDAGYSKQHQGTGLGLALTRRLVQAQGGEVGVRSAPGQGSVFHAVLPLVHGQLAPPAPVGLPALPAAAAQRYRLLVLEPDAAAQQRLLATLGAAGFEAEGATTAEQAWQRVRGQPFDGLMLDLHWPDQQGLRLLEQIRRIGGAGAGAAGRPLPVVGMALGAGAADMAYAITDILAKPLAGPELARALAPLGLAPGAAVLVVDDDAAARALMADMLAVQGLRPLLCADGRQALAELPVLQPKAIVLDLMMPGFSGLQVLDALQRDARWACLPVFIWTSLRLSDDEAAALARSAQAVVGSAGAPALDRLLARLPQPAR